MMDQSWWPCIRSKGHSALSVAGPHHVTLIALNLKLFLLASIMVLQRHGISLIVRKTLGRGLLGQGLNITIDNSCDTEMSAWTDWEAGVVIFLCRGKGAFPSVKRAQIPAPLLPPSESRLCGWWGELCRSQGTGYVWLSRSCDGGHRAICAWGSWHLVGKPPGRFCWT